MSLPGPGWSGGTGDISSPAAQGRRDGARRVKSVLHAQGVRLKGKRSTHRGGGASEAALLQNSPLAHPPHWSFAGAESKATPQQQPASLEQKQYLCLPDLPGKIIDFLLISSWENFVLGHKQHSADQGLQRKGPGLLSFPLLSP